MKCITGVAPGNSVHDILISEGDWRVQRFSWHDGSYISVQHYCTAGRSGSLFRGWVGMYYGYSNFTEPCYVCARVPAEKIQVVFTLLKWDEG